MASVQMRFPEEVVAAASTARTEELGFTPDQSVVAVLSVLALDGLKYRRLQHRERARMETYAAWADDSELHEDVRETFRWTIEAHLR